MWNWVIDVAVDDVDVVDGDVDVANGDVDVDVRAPVG